MEKHNLSRLENVTRSSKQYHKIYKRLKRRYFYSLNVKNKFERGNRYSYLRREYLQSLKFLEECSNREIFEEVYLNTPIERSFEACKDFSLINNYEETANFFKQIIGSIVDDPRKNLRRKVKINLRSIETVTIDAIMYLIAILTNLKTDHYGELEISGNLPRKKEAKKLFENSGFLKFLRSENTKPDANSRCILTGTNVSTASAKNIIDYSCKKLNTHKRKLQGVYGILIELMKNTLHHAYSEEIDFIARWYIYADFCSDSKIIRVSFLDTGKGIPETISKKIGETLSSIIDAENQSKLMFSAFDGTYQRSRTRLFNRGKGLPQVFETYKNKKIQNLKVFSCRGYLDFVNSNSKDKFTDKNENLRGTVYYFEIGGN